MVESCEYRWKLVDPNCDKNPGPPSPKGNWMTSRKACLKHFMYKYEKDFKYEKGDNPPTPYLYKRIEVPKRFLILGKCGYDEYKYKVKACFYRDEHLWTMHESKWGKSLRKTLTNFRDFERKGYDYVDCCCPIEYLYMRKRIDMKKLPPFELNDFLEGLNRDQDTWEIEEEMERPSNSKKPIIRTEVDDEYLEERHKEIEAILKANNPSSLQKEIEDEEKMPLLN